MRLKTCDGGDLQGRALDQTFTFLPIFSNKSNNKVTLERTQPEEQKLLKDPETKREYDRLGPKYELIASIIEKGLEKNLGQKGLTEKMNTKQSAVSRLESGNYNPSLSFIQKVAGTLDAKVEIKIS